MSMKEIGDKIKYYREVIYPENNFGTKLSQGDLGLKAFGGNNKNAVQQKIKKIESGFAKLSDIDIKKISKALGITPQELDKMEIPISEDKLLKVPWSVSEMFPDIKLLLGVMEASIRKNDLAYIFPSLDFFYNSVKETIQEKANVKLK